MNRSYKNAKPKYSQTKNFHLTNESFDLYNYLELQDLLMIFRVN